MAQDPKSKPTTSPSLVTFQDLRVKRGDRWVLSGLNAEVPRGSITALIGLNGSGKSTLLRTMLGELPYRGKIHYRCGHDHSYPRPEYVGYVPQRLFVDSRLPATVRELFGVALNRHLPLLFGVRKSVSERALALLNQVDAAHLLDRPVEGLSGGQLQRVLLALALEPKPELLLLDEPAAGIDFKDQDDFYKLIQSFHAESRVTILLVSHDIHIIRHYATHVLCLQHGTIRSQGSPANVLTDANISAIFGTPTRRLGE